jgi:menaquinol-cytochrome c reductase iron-sulfur subunit
LAPTRRPSKSKYTADRGIPGAFEGETVTRRRFMTGTAHGAGALMTLGIAAPALAFAIGPIFSNVSLNWQPVGPPDIFPDDNYVPAIITIAPGIGEAGKSTVYIRARNPKIDTTPPDHYNRWVAISTRCAHLGCPVRWVPAAERFICPCHGGVYDLQGVRVGGPPPRPLDRFYTRLNEKTRLVEVGRRYSVNSELRIFSPRDPSEPLDGIGQYLYPSRPSVRAF